jgi:hypothetical protein
MEHEQAVHNMAVEAYLLDELTPDEREAFEAHYFECAVCADDLRAASKFMEDAKGIFAADRPPLQPDRVATPKTSPGTWMRWLQPQFAGAALAVLVVVVGVETLGTIPGLRHRLNEASAPQIVAPTFLPPQTRGEPTPLKTISGQPAVLILDLPETSASELQFVVKSTDGRETFRVSEKTPPHRDPVTVFIPGSDLQPGRYTLLVEDGTANSPEAHELGQYPFEVK